MNRSNNRRQTGQHGDTTRRRMLAGTIASILALPVLACEQIVPGAGAPAQLYRLTPKSTFDGDLPSVAWQLVVEAPTAPAALNSTRITRMPSPTRLDYFARANWIDRAPQMVQGLLLESFGNSGRIVAVGRESVGLRPDFVLKSELREFQAEYFDTATPRIRVRIDAKLVQMPRRIIVASRGFEATATAKADRMQDIVEAFDLALGEVLQDVVKWTLSTGQSVISRQQRQKPDAGIARSSVTGSMERIPRSMVAFFPR